MISGRAFKQVYQNLSSPLGEDHAQALDVRTTAKARCNQMSADRSSQAAAENFFHGQTFFFHQWRRFTREVFTTPDQIWVKLLPDGFVFHWGPELLRLDSEVEDAVDQDTAAKDLAWATKLFEEAKSDVQRGQVAQAAHTGGVALRVLESSGLNTTPTDLTLRAEICSLVLPLRLEYIDPVVGFCFSLSAFNWKHLSATQPLTFSGDHGFLSLKVGAVIDELIIGASSKPISKTNWRFTWQRGRRRIGRRAWRRAHSDRSGIRRWSRKICGISGRFGRLRLAGGTCGLRRGCFAGTLALHWWRLHR